MTPNAKHKRAERERRRDAGEVRCEVWLSAEEARVVDYEAAQSGKDRAFVIRVAVRDAFTP